MASSGELPGDVDQDALIKDSLNEALGLGPLEDLLADAEVDQIIVDRRDRIVVGRSGAMSGGKTAFSSDQAFHRVIERLVAPVGASIDEDHPVVDVRLRDGARVTAAVAPAAVRGPCLSLRKQRSRGVTLEELIGGGALSAAMGDFLSTCVLARRNLVVCGSGAADCASLAAALAAAAPAGERLVSVEDVAELAIGRDDWVALEARTGAGAMDPAQLLRVALHLGADRLVVGGARGAEAYELVTAMASSHDGAVVMSGGDGAHAALSRLAGLARLGAPGAGVDALRQITAAAVNVVVHVARYADGVSRVAAISEVRGATVDGFDVQELFGFRGDPGAGDGGFVAAGIIPQFYAELEARGMPADTSIFRT